MLINNKSIKQSMYLITVFKDLMIKKVLDHKE